MSRNSASQEGEGLLALKVKDKKPGQRACDEKDEKGELCVGHLKRWHTAPRDVVQAVGRAVEIYRCERCHTVYRPAPGDLSSAGLKYDAREVNLLGDTIRPGQGK